jgi:hypothetical protein
MGGVQSCSADFFVDPDFSNSARNAVAADTDFGTNDQIVRLPGSFAKAAPRSVLALFRYS